MNERVQVIKFGGTSVESPKTFRQSAEIVTRHLDGIKKLDQKRVVVVVSAMGKSTDLLHNIIANAKKGLDYLPDLEKFHQQADLVVESLSDKSSVERLKVHNSNVVENINRYAQATSTFGTIPDNYRDWVVSAGERVSGPIFQGYLEEAGINSSYIDPDKVLMTDGKFGQGTPLINQTRDMLKTAVLPHFNRGEVVVMGGYFGGTKDGGVVTLGRGGSDRSATALAQALSMWYPSAEVYLYKADVAGVMSADPRVVPSAHLIDHLRYEEAADL